AWIEARRKFRAELESLGDVKKWLSNKPSLSAQEIRYLRRIKANRRAALEAAATDSPDVTGPVGGSIYFKLNIPLVCALYPQALVTLQNLLEKQQLRMVDVFLKAGRDGRKIERADFIRTEVPISDEDLEDVAISLTSSQPGNFIRLEDLIDCQKQWLEMRKEQARETKREARFQNTTHKTSTCPPPDTTAKGKKPHAPTKPKRTLISLDLPPIIAEPERRRVSCEEMEEIGKLSREKRRTQKDTDSPTERKEKSRVTRSGDGPIAEHCLLSTVGTDLGELVDRYRRKALVSYLGSSARCRERGIRITEPTLQRGLLHPGDKIIRDGEGIGRIRQPGGYYSMGGADGSTAGSSSGAGQEPGSQAKNVKKRSLRRNKKQKSSDNNFWPGHLLDKLCLYFPEKQHDRAHPLFSCVHPTKPAYRCI
ncbi:EFC12 protein, partial [Caloenas nicobarica]|nr:EFC12 protein [Caloenas nicobarica]